MKALLIIIGSIIIFGTLLYFEKRKKLGWNVSFASKEAWRKPANWVASIIIIVVLIVGTITISKNLKDGEQKFSHLDGNQDNKLSFNLNSEKWIHYGDTVSLKQGVPVKWHNVDTTYFAPVERGRRSLRIRCEKEGDPSCWWELTTYRNRSGKVESNVTDGHFGEIQPGVYTATLLSEGTARVIYSNKAEE